MIENPMAELQTTRDTGPLTMSGNLTAELRATLSRWARGAADLMERWGLQAHDGYLASESVLVLQGYDAEPEAGWDGRFDLHLDGDKLPWTPGEAEGEPIVAPPEVPLPELAEVPLSFMSTLKYSLPVTFLKPIELDDGGEIHVVSPRGIARMYTVDVMDLIAQKRAPAPAEEAWLRSGSERLGYLAGCSWPRRDRWFAKFCTEMIEIRKAILAGTPPRPSQMRKFGRRFVVV